MIHHGDCLEVMAGMEPESVDAVVTDPPYDLTSTGARKGSPRNPGTGPYSRGFMGKAWDGTGVAFRPETWAAAYRLARPSSYLLAFGGTRTVHRMAVAIEDAGWIIRDMLVWAYASGFPKSKASLKPAWEPIVMARKPGPLRMLAIDECRIPMSVEDAATIEAAGGFMQAGWEKPATATYNANGAENPMPTIDAKAHALGRWPANVVLTDPIFDGGIASVVGGGEALGGISVRRNGVVGRGDSPTYGDGVGYFPEGTPDSGYGDSGTYSRFFLIPKADRSDREPVIGGQLPVEWRQTLDGGPLISEKGTDRRGSRRANLHPTVKPTDLMRHLVRLVTPSGGTVLDPFLGSGTTGIACELEGFPWIGIEKEAEYVQIAEARLNGTQRGLGLSA